MAAFLFERRTMKKFLPACIIPACLLLSACAVPTMPPSPWPVIRAQLRALHGKPIKEAFKKLGYPDREEKIAGEKAYVWSTSNTMMVPSSSYTSGSGTVGNTPFDYGQTTFGGVAPVQTDCWIRIFVNKKGVITHHDGYGSFIACMRYAKMLDPHYNE